MEMVQVLDAFWHSCVILRPQMYLKFVCLAIVCDFEVRDYFKRCCGKFCITDMVMVMLNCTGNQKAGDSCG